MRPPQHPARHLASREGPRQGTHQRTRHWTRLEGIDSSLIASSSPQAMRAVVRAKATMIGVRRLVD